MDYLTIGEVSALIRVPVDTLRSWRAAGTKGPPSFRLGRRVVYKASELETWIVAERALQQVAR